MSAGRFAKLASIPLVLLAAALLIVNLAGAADDPLPQTPGLSKMDAVLAGLLARHEGTATAQGGDGRLYDAPRSSPEKEGVFPLHVDGDKNVFVDGLVKTSRDLAGCGKRARRTDVVGGASSSPTISVIS